SPTLYPNLNLAQAPTRHLGRFHVDRRSVLQTSPRETVSARMCILKNRFVLGLQLREKNCTFTWGTPKKTNLSSEKKHGFDEFPRNQLTSDLFPTSTAGLDRLKSDLVNCSYQYSHARLVHKSLLSEKHLDALKALLTRSDILITKPDKGVGIQKAKDQTQAIEVKPTNCLKRLKNEGSISEVLFQRLRPAGTTIPRPHGLPKVHKKDVPLRPILDVTRTPTCRYSPCDTFEFVELIKDVDIGSRFMCSLDPRTKRGRFRIGRAAVCWPWMTVGALSNGGRRTKCCYAGRRGLRLPKPAGSRAFQFT
ncbi:hypothetical protein X801_04848, partial [Opisthorchis viverrini]